MQTPPSPPHSAAAGIPVPALPMKAVVAVVIGNWLEFYDFLVFTFFAVMSLAAQRSSSSPGSSTSRRIRWFRRGIR